MIDEIGNEKQEDHESVCLSFLNGKKFECVDDHLNRTTSKKGVLVCGVTSHLSTFALLLATTTDTSCADDTFFWIAIGLLCGACLVCLVAIVINEVVIHRRKKRLEAFLKVCCSTLN